MTEAVSKPPRDIPPGAHGAPPKPPPRLRGPLCWLGSKVLPFCPPSLPQACSRLSGGGAAGGGLISLAGAGGDRLLQRVGVGCKMCCDYETGESACTCSG